MGSLSYSPDRDRGALCTVFHSIDLCCGIRRNNGEGQQSSGDDIPDSSCCPLIPGGSLYYTMEGLVNQDDTMFVENGVNTITIALAIALGFMLVSVLSRYIRIFLYKRK